MNVTFTVAEDKNLPVQLKSHYEILRAEQEVSRLEVQTR
jgi:hypothetical protein